VDSDWAICEVTGVRSFLGELAKEVDILVRSASSAAISSQSRLDLERRKDVQIVQQLMKGKLLATQKVLGPENAADTGTKYIDEKTFEKHKRTRNLGDPVAELPTVKGEVIAKRNSGLTQTKNGVRTCLAVAALASQFVGVRGEATGEHGGAPLNSVLLALVLGASMAFLGYLAVMWRQRQPTTVSQVAVAQMEADSIEMSRELFQWLDEPFDSGGGDDTEEHGESETPSWSDADYGGDFHPAYGWRSPAQSSDLEDEIPEGCFVEYRGAGASAAWP